MSFQSSESNLPLVIPNEKIHMLKKCEPAEWNNAEHSLNFTQWAPIMGHEQKQGLFIENKVCTRVTNCFSAHERVIFVFISRVAKQRGK